jgi:DNA-binding response OmpR family regulator
MHRSIVVVEDADALRLVVVLNLRRRGYLVREAATATEAIREVRKEQPDLLLLDICLPDRSGWDVLRELREQRIEVPTIIVSAVRVTQRRLAEFRPLAYLPKPFPLDALLRLVDGVAPSTDENDLLVESRSRLAGR